MIELTVRELLDSVEIFKTLLELKLRGRPAYLLARIMREVEKEYLLIQETQNELIKAYCIKDQQGNPILDEQNNYSIEPEKITEFNQKVNEELKTMISLNIDPLPISDLEALDFSVEQMVKLMPFIKE